MPKGMQTYIKQSLIENIIDVSLEAGSSIMDIYENDLEIDIQTKSDASLVTKADMISHSIIKKRLKEITPEIPIISEEDSKINFSERSAWNDYWLIDPMDGTKEFINRNGEFTVNIALINNNSPVFGVIHVPTEGNTYWGTEETGSYLLKSNYESTKLGVTQDIRSPVRIVCSRSHPSKELNTVLKKIKDYETIHIGSSLKFCLVASGKADCYPRLGPTSEWDTAAGEIIARSAGAIVVNLDNEALKYNSKEGYINPSFLVANNHTIKERILSIV